MSNIVALNSIRKEQTEKSDLKINTDQPADVVLFMGVRYERHEDEIEAEAKLQERIQTARLQAVRDWAEAGGEWR